jgi:A/G-specific adenine glycosylase
MIHSAPLSITKDRDVMTGTLGLVARAAARTQVFWGDSSSTWNAWDEGGMIRPSSNAQRSPSRDSQITSAPSRASVWLTSMLIVRTAPPSDDGSRAAVEPVPADAQPATATSPTTANRRERTSSADPIKTGLPVCEGGTGGSADLGRGPRPGWAGRTAPMQSALPLDPASRSTLDSHLPSGYPTAMPSSAPRAIAQALLRHFDAHRRAMPWRETSDPYGIWVSEIMLQQTRVDTVIPYWVRWMERFPTVDDLADADRDEVLKHWEGLGYYSRARNLHSAARVVRERYDGSLPRSPAELRKLPGIGEYTAGAVASIAYGVPAPAVDGNVRRVLSRLHDLETPGGAELRARAASLVPEDRPGDFNQALMELGATVCTPRDPSCGVCPLAPWCEAKRLGVQELRPLPAEKKPVPEEVVRTWVVVRSDGAVLLARRPDDGLLGGLWEFPGEPLTGPVAGVVDGAEPVASPGLRPVRHTFSHKRVTYRPELVRARGPAGTAGEPAMKEPGAGDLAWVRAPDLDAFALPVAQRKIAAQLPDRLPTP